MMTAAHKKWGKKSTWPTISARVDPALRDSLLKKHPNEGEVSNVIRALIAKYMDGKIFGLKIEV